MTDETRTPEADDAKDKGEETVIHEEITPPVEAAIPQTSGWVKPPDGTIELLLQEGVVALEDSLIENLNTQLRLTEEVYVRKVAGMAAEAGRRLIREARRTGVDEQGSSFFTYEPLGMLRQARIVVAFRDMFTSLTLEELLKPHTPVPQEPAPPDKAPVEQPTKAAEPPRFGGVNHDLLAIIRMSFINSPRLPVDIDEMLTRMYGEHWKGVSFHYQNEKRAGRYPTLGDDLSTLESAFVRFWEDLNERLLRLDKYLTSGHQPKGLDGAFRKLHEDLKVRLSLATYIRASRNIIAKWRANFEPDQASTQQLDRNERINGINNRIAHIIVDGYLVLPSEDRTLPLMVQTAYGHMFEDGEFVYRGPNGGQKRVRVRDDIRDPNSLVVSYLRETNQRFARLRKFEKADVQPRWVHPKLLSVYHDIQKRGISIEQYLTDMDQMIHEWEKLHRPTAD